LFYLRYKLIKKNHEVNASAEIADIMAGDEDAISEKDSMETDSLLNESRNESPEPMQLRTVSHKNDFQQDGPSQNIVVQNGLAKYNSIATNNTSANTTGVRFNSANQNTSNENPAEGQAQNEGLSKLSEFNNYSDPLSSLVNNMNYANFALTKPPVSQAVNNMVNNNNNNQHVAKNVRNHFGSDKTNSANDLNRLRSEAATNQANNNTNGNNSNADYSGRHETSSTDEMSSGKIKSILKRSSSFDTSLNVIGQQASLTNFALKTPEKPSAAAGAVGPRDSIEVANSRMNSSAASRIDSGKKSVRFATQFMTSAAPSKVDSLADYEETDRHANIQNQQKANINELNCKPDFFVFI
jgi:hypothetical protein